MARTLCPDRERASIAVAAALVILLSSSSVVQIGAIVFGGIAGLWFCRTPAATPSDEGHMLVRVSRRAGLVALTAFFLLLAGLPILGNLTHSQVVALFEAFYRSGALVFGGGHVVLPLLREATVAQGWVTDDVFLAGYGAAQAVPGPRSWSHPQEPAGEEWWADVLADPRARKRERRTDLAVKQAFYRLADEKRETILVACSKCDWRAAFSRDDLIASHGANYAMPNLLNHLAAPSCNRLGSHWDRCGVHYIEPIEGS
jgi:chromate transport protein ChrA